MDPLPDVKSGDGSGHHPLVPAFAVLRQLRDILPPVRREGGTRGLAPHAASPRAAQTVSLGGHLFTASLARSRPARNLLLDDGAVIVLHTAPDEFSWPARR